MKKTRLCIARFVWCMLPRKGETCWWSRTVLTEDTSQDSLNMKRATVMRIPQMHIFWMFVKDPSSTICKRNNSPSELNKSSILKCIIDVIFYIGFQVISYRGKNREAVATVFDESNHDNRGNFLEASCRIQSTPAGTFAEGHFAGQTKRSIKESAWQICNFLSKTTVNERINIISDIVENEIMKEVKNAGMFSVQIDSTQNISAHLQCAIVLRYVVRDRAKERLLYFDLRPGQTCHSKVMHRKEVTHSNGSYERRSRKRAWLTKWDKVKIPWYTHRLILRKIVTSELHDSYFRLMTIKHAIPKIGWAIEWAIEWALNYYITRSRQEVRQLELETRCGRESHTRPMWPSGPPIELGSREVSNKMW